MNNQVQVGNNSKWSLFQAFCCGTKVNKKKTAVQNNNNQQNNMSSNKDQMLSSPAPQIILNQYSSIHNQNNQTNIQMRPRSFVQDEDEVSSYSSNLQPQHQQQQQRDSQPLPQHNQHQYQQNNVINIQSNHHHHYHSRQVSSNYENHYPQSNISNQLAPPIAGGSQSHRRAYSVNYNNNNNINGSSYNGNSYSSNNNNSNIHIINSNLNNNSNNQQYQSEQRLDTQNSQASNSSQKQPRYYTMANQFFRLKTKFAIHEVDFVESRPTDKTFQNYFNFDCPICFRHFNKILKSDCCDHYLCHYCLRDIYNKAKESPNFDYRCMFCQISIPQYIDVDDAADKVKRYSDSPFITPKDAIVERTVKGFVPTSHFDHNIHSNLIEFQDDSMDKENIDFKQNEINIINNCSTTHNINKPPLPHLVLNQNMQIPQLQQLNNQRREMPQHNLREKNGSMLENENVNQSAHKPAGTIPEFQNKYHCNYLQHSSTQKVQSISQIVNSQQQPKQQANIKQIR